MILLYLIRKKIENFSYLKSQSRPDNYISPAWNAVNNKVTSLVDVMSVITKSWLIGFTEAAFAGSFYIVKKSPLRLVHAFEITPYDFLSKTKQKSEIFRTSPLFFPIHHLIHYRLLFSQRKNEQ